MKTKDLYVVIVSALLLLAGIQPAHAIDIPTSDTSIGYWDGNTFILVTDLDEGIEIIQDNFTLDGNGHMVSGSGPGSTVVETGVLLVDQTGVTIQDLKVKYFDYAQSGVGISFGIHIESCSNVTLTGNNIISDNYWGIYLYNSSNITVTGNDISNNAGGIWLNTVSNGNTLEGNTVSDNGASGIYIRDSSNNIVKNNTSSGNGVGIRINDDAGTSTNNQIYNNNFISNAIQADTYGESTGNVFDLALPTGGNYWNTWTSPDSDGDGIVDNPYLIYDNQTQKLMAQDDLPWTIQDGWLNDPPEITEITIEPTPLGSLTTLTATFTDPDIGDTHIATINWGDELSTETPGTIVDGTVTGSFTYNATGVYTVTLTITDRGGAGVSSTSTAYAAVYDPDAFTFVTGAGWIPDEEVECGKVLFGFFCKQLGSYDPCGHMRIRWGDNRFNATEFDWLVVDEDGAATFAGVGTINGEGEYFFMIDITDDPDTIDIFIPDVSGYDTYGPVDLGCGWIRIRHWSW